MAVPGATASVIHIHSGARLLITPLLSPLAYTTLSSCIHLFLQSLAHTLSTTPHHHINTAIMVKNMQGLSRKTSTQSFHHSTNSPPPAFDMPSLLREKLEAELNKAAYTDYRSQLELLHEHNKQCLRLEQLKLDPARPIPFLHPSFRNTCPHSGHITECRVIRQALL
jgi:hypothetical protein